MRLIREGLLWTRLGDEVVILDQRTEVYLGINPTGAALWDLLVAGCRRDDLVSRLVDAFGIPTDAASQDVDDFVESLRHAGLLDGTDNRSGPLRGGE